MLLLFAADSPAGPDPRALINQVVTAYGGRAALEKATAYRSEGKVVTAAGREAPTMRLFQRPGRLRVELRYPDKPETRIVDGENGWRGAGGEVTPASGMMLDAMILQAARADLPWFLLQHADSARVIEPLEHGGHTLLGLEVPYGRGLSLRAYVNAQTGRVEVSRSVIAGEQEMMFQTDYSDFRKVGKVLFAFHEDNTASGAATGTITLQKIVLGPKIVTGDFGAPPEKTKAE